MATVAQSRRCALLCLPTPLQILCLPQDILPQRNQQLELVQKFTSFQKSSKGFSASRPLCQPPLEPTGSPNNAVLTNFASFNLLHQCLDSQITSNIFDYVGLFDIDAASWATPTTYRPGAPTSWNLHRRCSQQGLDRGKEIPSTWRR